MLSSLLILQAIFVIFISGILYGFSDFIMRGLNSLAPKSAIAAMRGINTTVYRSLFMILFVGLVATSIIASVWLTIVHGWQDSVYVILGSFLYIFGMFMVTGRGNVPLNESLGRSDIEGGDSERIWSDYYIQWTRLNTLRCLFGVLAGVSWVVAAYLLL